MVRFFAHAKKRYFGKIIWPEESLLVRGYEPRRTDSFDLQSETMTKVFQLVLDGKPEEAVKYAKDTVNDTLKGKVSLPALVISKSVNEFSSYKDIGSPENIAKQQEQLSGANANIALGSSLVHVNVAGQLQDMGYEFTPGMKMPFVITNGSMQPLKAEPVIEGVKFTGRPDYKYYAERLAMALARITEPFGCDERALLQGNSQRSLEFFSEEKPAPKAEPATPQAAVKKVKQKATLDMFM
jgi:DNA polymerase I